MWFKNLKIYRLSSACANWHEQLESALARQAYQGSNTLDGQSIGWVPTRTNGNLVYTVNAQLLLTLRVEKKLLPATVITQVTQARAQEAEERQGYKPGRKQRQEIRQRVTDELLPQAFSIYRDTRIWIDPINRWLVIDTGATAKADEVLGYLAKSLDTFPLENLRVTQSPACAMTAWLAADTAPHNFCIDQDTELRAAGESRAAIRYVKHAIDVDDMRRHIAGGKQCTRLALTWADRISFMLTESLDIKRVTPLEVLKESPHTQTDHEDEKFDNDMTLMTGELTQMMTELVDALGGET